MFTWTVFPRPETTVWSLKSLQNAKNIQFVFYLHGRWTHVFLLYLGECSNSCPPLQEKKNDFLFFFLWTNFWQVRQSIELNFLFFILLFSFYEQILASKTKYCIYVLIYVISLSMFNLLISHSCFRSMLCLCSKKNFFFFFFFFLSINTFWQVIKSIA